MRILVVDDEHDVQDLFKQGFRKEIREGQYSFSFAFDGQQALDFLDTLEPFDIFLILSDINMPGMTGIEMVKEIKRKRPDLNIIMLTAYGDRANYEASIQNGALDLLTKPLDFALLRQQLNALNPNLN